MNRLHSYHSAGSLLIDHSRDIGARDIAAMSAADKKNILFAEARSRFTIGFEIEKSNVTTMPRGEDLEFPLFACCEADGSLPYEGGEGVTNILPLVGKSMLRTKLRNEIIAARPFLDLPVNQQCGGHVTVRVEGMSSEELFDACRPFMGILYAIWRHRLKNSFCRGDIFYTGNRSAAGLHVNNPSKYRICKKRGNGMIEFRFPSAIRTTEALLVRYDLFYALLDCAANDKSPAVFRRMVKPILSRMYRNDSDKVSEMMRLGSRFNAMLASRTINAAVMEFVDPDGQLQQHYTDSARAQLRAARNRAQQARSAIYQRANS